ncbi:MAG: UDP-2,3-diacylglucosamine diphosphatase [Xanthomonadales bacterium]|nr:UDP-2,3-diacylglucosamine diphosphatase [Xanthomonadales bacterium]
MFISDLHLKSEDDVHTRILLRFLREEAPGAGRLFVLGDLFEAYVGDDDGDPLLAVVADALHALAAMDVEIAFVHGNRDFLLGKAFADRANMLLLPDPCVIDLAGKPVLLSHGDRYCTDDREYMRWRAQMRDRDWQSGFLGQPLAARKAFAERARAASAEHQKDLSAGISDVNAATVEGELRLFGIDTLIHGHTHRPACHQHDLGGSMARRWVLSDWRGHGEALVADERGTLSRVSLFA